MGMLVGGRWSEDDRVVRDGAYCRPASVFNADIGADIVSALAREPGRFHLIASFSCPWSHRTMLVRRIKGLASGVPLQITGGARVQGYPANSGMKWTVPGADIQITHLHELYALSDPRCTGRVTLPVLWDARERRVVSGESAKIIRALDAVAGRDGLDFALAPEKMRPAIDALNREIYDGLSNGVYRAGFAASQAAYDAAVDDVFAALDRLESRLSDRRYLLGEAVTESDWRLFPTLVRFDAVYHVLFRCCRRRLIDYPALWAYARDLFAWPGVASTLDFAAMREGSYRNDRANNPAGLVAATPDMDWQAPHGRDALGEAKVFLKSGATVPRSLLIGRRASDFGDMDSQRTRLFLSQILKR